MIITILLNGVGGPTPRSIAKSLLRYSDLDVRIIGTDSNPHAHGLYEDDLYEKTYLIPCCDDPDYWPCINEIVELHQIDLAIVQPEQEVIEWTRRKSLGLDWPCKALLPDFDLVRCLINKSRMTEILKGTKFVPHSYTINPDCLDIHAIEKNLEYPFWIRSTVGSSGLGSLKIRNQMGLINWITMNPDVSQFIGSEFLPGRNLACKLLFYKGELLRAACAERVHYIMSKVAPSGITGNTSFGRLLNEPDLIDFCESALRIIEKQTRKPLHGFFTADLKEDKNGKPYLTEINVRMVAFNLSFAMGGANFSEDLVRLIMDEENFDKSYSMYYFKEDYIFLRDVDGEPKLMREGDLKSSDMINMNLLKFKP